MSPSATQIPAKTRRTPPYQRPGVFVYGVGVEYPPHTIKPEELGVLARRWYPSSPALEKVLTINAYTGIDSRSSIGTIEHPLVNQRDPPSIETLHQAFMQHAIPLSVSACRKALKESRTRIEDITHVVSTTCTNSANPGYDHFVCKELGLAQDVQKVLLHGVGCSGGMAALRTASGLIMGEKFRGRRARVLVLACEISTALVRSELESICEGEGETRIGVCLFSDCASCLVVGNDVEEEDVDGDVEVVDGPESLVDGMNEVRLEERKGEGQAIMEVLGWEHRIIEDTEHDLGFDVHPLGWKVILTPRVPSLTSAALPSIFSSLISSIPLLRKTNHTSPDNFYWALHPGGATILSGVEKVMGLTPEHMRASYEVYMGHGNSSSATWGSVVRTMLDGGEDVQGREQEYVVGCAFGPGIAVEMAVLRRLDLDGEERRKVRKASNGVNGVNGTNGAVNGDHSGGSSETEDSGSVNGSGSGGTVSPVEALIAEAEEVD